VNQQQSTAALFRAKCSFHCSVLLCKTGSQQTVCHCGYTYGDFLFLQVCNDPAPIFCSTVQGKMQSPLLLSKTGSQQAVCHWSYTYGYLLFVKVYSEPATKHCSTVQGKMQFPLFSVAVQNKLTADSVSLRLHLWRFVLHTGVQ